MLSWCHRCRPDPLSGRKAKIPSLRSRDLLAPIQGRSIICISASAYDQVLGKVVAEFVDLGEHTLKNIARPVRAYAVVPNGFGGGTRTDAIPSPRSAPHLSMVVLPFANIGGGPEQDYFADGITESLTTDLSRISGSFVIASNTALTFKGKAVDVKHLGRELNVPMS
jgi:hypothetical protein